MRILLATDLFQPAINGVVTSTVSLKRSLEEMGHDVRVLTLAKDGYINHTEKIYAVSSLNVNKVYPGARLKLFSDRSILSQIFKWHPDIIHTQSEFSTFRMAKQIAHYLNIPIVHTYHTIYEDYTHYFSPHKKTGRQIVSVLTKRVLNEVEEVIVPTNKVYSILKDYEVNQPITVIPSGIQLDQFQETFLEGELLKLREQYNIPKDAFLLVSLGRLGKEKNIDEIISFLSLLKEKNIHFLIVGDGPYKSTLMEQVEELGLQHFVHFTGMVSPKVVALYYQLADLFVCASTSETQGLTYIEALASGRPALCRKDESIEAVVINGITGYQYSHYKEFETYLHELMHKPELYQKMAQQAQNLVFEDYSSQSFGAQVYSVYNKAIQSHYSKQRLHQEQ